MPYDVAVRPYDLEQAEAWIRAAEARHQKILVAFYHSEYTPMRMPSVATYKRDVAKFIKRFPHIREYQAWDEANRGYVSGYFQSPTPVQDAQYYQALKRDCIPCTVVGLDVLDQYDIDPTIDYIAEFKREIGRLRTVMPTTWGLHDYSDVNRLESWRTRDLEADLGGEVWLTETGGIVKFGDAFPNNHGSGLRRAAKVLNFMFGVAASNPRIKRLYIYDWTGGDRLDALRRGPDERPRPAPPGLRRGLQAAARRALQREDVELRSVERDVRVRVAPRSGQPAFRRSRSPPGALRQARAPASASKATPAGQRDERAQRVGTEVGAVAQGAWGRRSCRCPAGPGGRSLAAVGPSAAIQRPGGECEQAGAQRAVGTGACGGSPHAASDDRADGGEQERPDAPPPAPEAVGGGDRGLEVALAQVAHPDDRLGLVADQRVRDRGDHGRT